MITLEKIRFQSDSNFTESPCMYYASPPFHFYTYFPYHSDLVDVMVIYKDEQYHREDISKQPGGYIDSIIICMSPVIRP